MRLSVITDEVSDDMTLALRMLESFDVGAVEIRVFGGRNVTAHPPEDWRRLAVDLRAGGFDCPVVDSPFLKDTRAPSRSTVDWSPLDRAIDAAGALGARTVRVFSGSRVFGGGSDHLVDVLGEAVRRAAVAGLGIAVEIEPVCEIATAAEAVALADRARAPTWGYVLDPGNESYLTGRPADISAVAKLTPLISHVHVKDVDTGRDRVRVGTGVVGWADQLGTLRDCGYTGYLSMETPATRESVASLRALAATAGIDLT